MSMKLRIALALMFAGLLMLYPEASLSAARSAMAVWAQSYAPTMLPFFIILPVLSCAEAASLYEKLFSGAMRLFGCPGRAAGAVLLGVLAGSPAGTTSLARLAAHGGMTRGELSRAQILCSGLSPLFLLSGIGISMLGSHWAGMLLLRAQLGALLISGLLFRGCWRGDDRPVHAPATEPPGGAVREAALSVLTVCGYMVFFGVIARLLAQFVGEAWEAPLLALVEVAGGSAALAQADLPEAIQLVLIAFFCCTSGLAILFQNVSRLAPSGIPARRLVLGKLTQGLIGALLCAAQIRWLPMPRQAAAASAPAFAGERSAVIAALVLILVGAGLVFLQEDAFPNPPRRVIIKKK